MVNFSDERLSAWKPCLTTFCVGMCLGRLQINWTGSSCFSVQVWRWMVMKNYKWVVNFSCSKLLKEWWWRPTSEFVNFSCSELLIYPYLAWNDLFIPIYVLNELLQANIRIRTITRICGDRWSIFAQVILTLLILSCAAQYVLCSHCCYNCHQTSWMDLASFVLVGMVACYLESFGLQRCK